MLESQNASVVTHHPDFRALSKIEAVGIVIPTRNQSGAIAKCVRSIFAANSHAGWRNSLWIVVVADACTDSTAKVARDAVGAFGEVLQVAARSEQTAHQIGVSAIMEHFCRVPRHALLLCSADAGTDLCRDWIDTRLRRLHPLLREAVG